MTPDKMHWSDLEPGDIVFDSTALNPGILFVIAKTDTKDTFVELQVFEINRKEKYIVRDGKHTHWAFSEETFAVVRDSEVIYGHLSNYQKALKEPQEML